MGMHIRALLVEDSEPDAELLVRELQQDDMESECEIVATPEEMSAALEDGPWDVVIADYVMPHFSGLDAFKMARREIPDTPVIIVSGKIDDEVAVAAMLAGAKDYVLKSSLTRLGPAVRREIRDARRHERAEQARRKAEEALRQAYEELERRIAERTSELFEANVLLGREISEREQAQRQLAEARAEAEKQAAEFRSFITSMADGVVVWNLAGEIVFINDAGRKLLGMPLDVTGEAFSHQYEVFALDGEKIAEEQWGSRQALGGKEVRDFRVRIVTPWTEATISYSAAPVLDAAGRVIGATSVMRDVHDEVELERQRRELYDREHYIAQVLQNALVPPMTYMEVGGCRAALRYEPALAEAEVGGDFYDVFELSDDRVGIVIGDVAGKGLDAAVYVAAAKHAIRSYAYVFDSPAEVMKFANDALCKTELEDGTENKHAHRALRRRGRRQRCHDLRKRRPRAARRQARRRRR